MIVRLLACLIPCALLVSCSAETSQVSSGSTSRDTAPAATGVGTPTPQPDDTAPAAEQPEEPQPGPEVLTPDGWGPLRIGMSHSEVVAAAGEDAHPDAVGGPDPEQCDEFRPRNSPEGVLVMIERGFLTRISVSRNTDIATPAGLHVGDAGSDVEDAYGARARVDPHEYQDAPARYITVWREAPSPSERRGIRYEIDASGRVVHMRGGGPSIEYVEGCV